MHALAGSATEYSYIRLLFEEIRDTVALHFERVCLSQAWYDQSAVMMDEMNEDAEREQICVSA